MTPCSVRSSHHLVGPYLEANQSVWPKCLGDRDIGGVAPLPYQHAPDARHVVARIEGVPAAAEIGLEPAGEIARPIRRRSPHVAKVSGAIARRNIHAAAERNCEVGIITADAL